MFSLMTLFLFVIGCTQNTEQDEIDKEIDSLLEEDSALSGQAIETVEQRECKNNFKLDLMKDSQKLEQFREMSVKDREVSLNTFVNKCLIHADVEIGEFTDIGKDNQEQPMNEGSDWTSNFIQDCIDNGGYADFSSDVGTWIPLTPEECGDLIDESNELAYGLCMGGCDSSKDTCVSEIDTTMSDAAQSVVQGGCDADFSSCKSGCDTLLN